MKNKITNLLYSVFMTYVWSFSVKYSALIYKIQRSVQVIIVISMKKKIKRHYENKKIKNNFPK